MSNFSFYIAKLFFTSKKTWIKNPSFLFLSNFIYNQRRSCSYLNIFYFVYPSRRTFRPNSRARFRHRTQDIRPFPYVISRVRRIVFHNFCICIVKEPLFSPFLLDLFRRTNLDFIRHFNEQNRAKRGQYHANAEHYPKLIRTPRFPVHAEREFHVHTQKPCD